MIGKIVNRVCPRCGGELEVGISGRVLMCASRKCYLAAGHRYYIEPLPEDLKLRLVGAATLPGIGVH